MRKTEPVPIYMQTCGATSNRYSYQGVFSFTLSRSTCHCSSISLLGRKKTPDTCLYKSLQTRNCCHVICSSRSLIVFASWCHDLGGGLEDQIEAIKKIGTKVKRIMQDRRAGTKSYQRKRKANLASLNGKRKTHHDISIRYTYFQRHVLYKRISYITFSINEQR